MRSLVIMAFRNVRKNWRHSLAAILTISAALVTQVLFGGYMSYISNLFVVGIRNESMHGDLIIEHEGLAGVEAKTNPFKFYLTETQQEKIDQFLKENEALVASSVKFLRLDGLASNPKTSAIFSGLAYEPKAGELTRGPSWSWNALYGVPLQEESSEQAVLLAPGLGKILGCVPVKTEVLPLGMEGYPPVNRPFTCLNPTVQMSLLTETGQINAIDLKVIGMVGAGYKELNNIYIQTTLSVAQRLLNTRKVSFYTVLLRDAAEGARVVSAFEKKIKPEIPQMKVYHWYEHPISEIYHKTMNLLKMFKLFVMSIVLTISCLSILNMMVKIIKERTREIGTLRSLGYVRSQILLLFSAEALFLALFGTFLGTVASLALSFGINYLKIPYEAGVASQPMLLTVEINPIQYVMSFILLTSLTIVVAIIVSRAATRQSVAQNLVYV